MVPARRGVTGAWNDLLARIREETDSQKHAWETVNAVTAKLGASGGDERIWLTRRHSKEAEPDFFGSH